VLEAAVGLADQEGIAGLTMRRLAQQLGVEAMSLYHYVSGKDEILDAIVDLALSEVELPAGNADWKAALRRGLVSAHAVLLRHPWAASLMLSSVDARPARLRFMDWLLGTLRGAGFTAVQTDHAYHAVESHITGYTLWQVSMPFEAEDLPAIGAAFLDRLAVDAYPHVAEHVQQHLLATGECGSDFEFGLDLILDGLERIRRPA
jgi:AcrR family transcriptional regulator